MLFKVYLIYKLQKSSLTNLNFNNHSSVSWIGVISSIGILIIPLSNKVITTLSENRFSFLGKGDSIE